MQKKKGISLIVLVITIIVMIVLAGAIILSLNNAGIIEKANEAVEVTDEAQLHNIAQLGWAEAYTVHGSNLEELRNGVKNALKNNGLDSDDYGIIVTEKGVKIAKGWLQDGTIVTKGDVIEEVGELVAYDETKAGTEEVEKNVSWKILGAENGELLIISADSVVMVKHGLGDYTKAGDIELAKSAVINGKTELNTICEAYGKGDGAISSRSVKIEDINRVTGYNPTTADWGKDTLYEYGNEVTYMWNGSGNPYFVSSKQNKGNLTAQHNGNFIYYDGKTIITSTNEGATEETPKTITTLQNNTYSYYATTLTNTLDVEKIGLPTDSKAYKALFKNSLDMDDNYWLASSYTRTNNFCVYFGMNYVGENGCIGRFDLLTSHGNPSGKDYYVRAVISLGKDITFNGSTSEGLTF